jgi:hypothetical protein
MSNRDVYSARVKDAERAAVAASDPQVKEAWLEIAKQWATLARQTAILDAAGPKSEPKTWP